MAPAQIPNELLDNIFVMKPPIGEGVSPSKALSAPERGTKGVM
jgi:hypothetical protein